MVGVVTVSFILALLFSGISYFKMFTAEGIKTRYTPEGWPNFFKIVAGTAIVLFLFAITMSRNVVLSLEFLGGCEVAIALASYLIFLNKIED